MPEELIPGKKKTPVYKKNGPFKLKSGNSPIFKKMGSSALKAELPKFSDFLKEASMRDLKTAFEM